jgi:sensor c-di-GMP phosphodiesterase-like protein
VLEEILALVVRALMPTGVTAEQVELEATPRQFAKSRIREYPLSLILCT